MSNVLRFFRASGWLLIPLLVLVNIYFHKDYINEFPQHIHGWAEADHYSIAKGFVNNNFDFFHPQINSLNKQFPHANTFPHVSPVTPTDFPIHHFNVAILMKLFNADDPWVFRGYYTLISFITCCFVFRIFKLFTSNKTISVLLTIGVVFTPIYTYYSAGFLPSIGALFFNFIGLFYYFKSYHNSSFKTFLTGAVFLGLGSMVRTPQSIFLIGVIGLELFNIIFKNRRYPESIIKRFTPFIMVIVCVGGYFLYNKYLEAIHGSALLSRPKPPSTWEEFQSLSQLVWEKWIYAYFSEPQTWLLGVLLVLVVWQMFKSQKISYTQKQLLVYTLGVLLGGVVYAVLMMRQLKHHDYYFLDAFYITWVLIFVVFASFLKNKISNSLGFLLVLVVLVGYLDVRVVEFAKKGLANRRSGRYGTKMEKYVSSYQKGKHLVKDLGISSSEKILCLGAFSTNAPLVILNRQGYIVQESNYTYLDKALNWDYDYIFSPKRFVSKVLLDKRRGFFQHVDLVKYSNGIFVFKKGSGVNPDSIDKLINTKVVYFTFNNNFNQDKLQHWKYKADHLIPDKGGLLVDTKYGLEFKKKFKVEEFENVGFIKISGSAELLSDSNNVELIVSILDNAENKLFFKSFPLVEFIKDKDHETAYSFETVVNPIKMEEFYLSVYVRNIKPLSKLVLKNIKIELLEH